MNNINPNSPGFVYVIKATSWVAQVPDCMYKIGLSIHPDIRLDQLQQGVAPFAKLELVFSLPVSSMYQVEQKLHDLFQEENIHNEWFCLEPHKLEAVRALGAQVSTLVRPRVRRATADIRYNLPASALASDEHEVVLPTALESLILSYIRHSRSKLSQKVKGLLDTPVMAVGRAYGSPEELYGDSPEFKVWVERKLFDLSKIPNMTIDRAVYSIRMYDHPQYGWVKHESPDTITHNDTYTIPYGDD